MSEERLRGPVGGATGSRSGGAERSDRVSGPAGSSPTPTVSATPSRIGGADGRTPQTAHTRALGGPARPAHASGPRFDTRVAFDPVQIRLDPKTCRDLTRASKKEWLLANGLGGFSTSTVAGLNTRRYHGLLVAQMRPPLGRAVILSKMDETLVLPAGPLALDTNFYPGVVHPRGFEHIEGFSLYPFPSITFSGPGWKLEKTIHLVHGENTVVVSYRMLPATRPRRVGRRGKAGAAAGDSGVDAGLGAAPSGSTDGASGSTSASADDAAIAPYPSLTLRVRPLFALRPADQLSEQNARIDRTVGTRAHEVHGSIARFTPYPDWDPIYLVCPQAQFIEQPDWYKSVEYPQERYRGLEFRDDLWTYGYYEIELETGDALSIACTLHAPERKAMVWPPEREMERRGQLVVQSPDDKPFVRRLALATEQFFVRRDRDVGAVLAGYPWSADVTRDTLIGMPGLFLSTGRHREAKSLLRWYARALERGLLPDRLPDAGVRPQFGSVDATLWFFVAVFKYLQYTGDFDFVKTELRIPMLETIRYYSEGTRYGVRVESDGLLRSGEPGMALTWMDAIVDGKPVTQRAGKPVEVNALWYNALRIMERLAERFSIPNDMARFARMADKLEENFLPVYWNARAGCLYDCIDAGGADASIRPNQLFAVSLPFPLLDSESAQSVVRVVGDKLLTPMGLRTLDPEHPDFKGVYDGDPSQRDGALHQGTVWAWLLGPYVSALVKANGAAARVDAAKLLKPFEQHLLEDGLGHVSEIFWGNPPHWPRGRPEHMLATAEILRAYCEDVLARVPGQKPSVPEPALRSR
jgi:predicted glycogen debranching enzyme